MNFYAIYRGGSLKAGKWEFHGRVITGTVLLINSANEGTALSS